VRIISTHLRSTCSLGIIASFVVFLAASAPHRVHHLFENLPKPYGQDHHAHPPTQSDATDHSHTDHHAEAHSADPLHADTPHDDQNHDGTAQTVCLLQGAAQHSHLSTVQLAKVAFLYIESEEWSEGQSPRLSPFNPSPFSQRAPPKV
jgi:hypothetical protein